MKLGPIKISRSGDTQEFSEKPKTGKEFGATGTKNYGGILTNIDYNNDWAAGYGSKKWTTINEMRLSDGQVKGTLKYCKEPLMAANWDVEPASDDKRDREIADFIAWNLFEGCRQEWEYILRHFLLALDYGYMLFEKVWEFDRGTSKFYCSKLSPRMPSTIFRWKQDENGDLASVEQIVTAKSTEPIPVEKLIHFAIDQEGGNYEGISILRSAYKHWKMKLAYEKISVMSYERFGMGVVHFKEPEDPSEEDRDRADEIGENLRAHENSYVRTPNGWEMEIIFGQNWKSADAQIRYHNEMISAAVLQQFTNLGTMERGSRAVGQVLQDPYYLSLESLAGQICRKINKLLIPELVRYNWEGVEEYPQLRCSNIKADDFASIAEALSKLAAGPVPYVTANYDTEQHLRRIMRLPELKEQEQRAPTPNPEEEEGKKASEGGNPLEFKDFRRELKPHERFVEFKDIDSTIDKEADSLTAKLTKIRRQQMEQLASDIAGMAARGRLDPNKVKVKLFGKMADAVKGAMKEAHQYGKEKAEGELKKQKAADTLERRKSGERTMKDKKPRKPRKIKRKSPPFLEVVDNRADLVVEASNQQLRNAALKAAVPLMKEGLAKEVLYDNLLDQLVEISEKGLRMECVGAITEAINEGRADFAAAAAHEYEKGIRSGLLDENICTHCSSEDGNEFSVEEAVDVTLPDPGCEGGDRCRCLMVYVSKAEEKAVA